MGIIHSSGSEPVAMTLEIPINLSLAAADRILALKLWPQFKTMLEHASQAIPSLHSIVVSLDDQAQPGDPTILLIVEVDGFPSKTVETTEWQWDRWAIMTFPPDVLRHFSLMIVPSEDLTVHGG